MQHADSITADSAYIFVGNLDRRLTEGDVITIFSQYGEVLDINLPRIPEGGLRDRGGSNGQGEPPLEQQQRQQQQQGGKPGDRRGFGFLLYEDQRSTVLAVDNLNGFSLLGRTIRVDHVRDYKMPGAKKREEEGEIVGPSRNAAPVMLQHGSGSENEEADDAMDLADPMASYIAASKREKGKSREEREERRRRKEERKRKREARGREGSSRGDDGYEASRRSEEGREGGKRSKSGAHDADRHGSRERQDADRHSSHRSSHHSDEQHGHRDKHNDWQERRDSRGQHESSKGRDRGGRSRDER